MELKGSQTEKNLLAAFSGESMARNKYLFFAEKAKQENHPEIQELFESMAKNEGMHGKLLFQRAAFNVSCIDDCLFHRNTSEVMFAVSVAQTKME